MINVTNLQNTRSNTNVFLSNDVYKTLETAVNNKIYGNTWQMLVNNLVESAVYDTIDIVDNSRTFNCEILGAGKSTFLVTENVTSETDSTPAFFIS